ncbi:MAG: DsrE family protein [Proteobacteria bacterium]|nr:DsrE family protein [Pseudomonadota bacterium]
MNLSSLSRRRVFAATAVAIGSLASALSLASAQSPTAAKDKKAHRLAIHVDDNDAQKMNLALNNAANVSKHFTDKGEEVEIEIVAYGPGLHMLRSDTSPAQVQGRLKSFSESMPNVTFSACENTRTNMARAEGKKAMDIPLVHSAKSVESGVVRLIELQEQGWSYVKP